MMPERLLELARERVSIEHGKQIRDLDRAFDEAAHHCRGKDVLQPGMLAKAIGELCASRPPQDAPEPHGLHFLHRKWESVWDG